MKLLGITGGIGAGKSAVTRLFQALGATVVDADAIAHQVMQPGGTAYAGVVSAFGKEILTPDAEIDRKKLAAIVFSDSEERNRLNALTHGTIFQEMQRQIGAANTELVCLDVPLLFDSDFPFVCDKTLAVLAPKEIRIARVMARDGATREQVEARMAAQRPQEELEALADVSIHNIGTEQELIHQVTLLYHNIME